MGKYGKIPERLQMDKIICLYKNKGKKEEPKNWRPITFGCSIGKSFDKVFLVKYSHRFGGHRQNHSYTPNKSCISAIADVHEKLRETRNTSQQHRKKGFFLLPFIDAEDVSAAFESIAHYIIDKVWRTGLAGRIVMVVGNSKAKVRH